MWWVPAAEPRASRRALLAALGIGLVAIVAGLGTAGSALAGVLKEDGVLDVSGVGGTGKVEAAAQSSAAAGHLQQRLGRALQFGEDAPELVPIDRLQEKQTIGAACRAESTARLRSDPELRRNVVGRETAP